jgi:hypothetical protein
MASPPDALFTLPEITMFCACNKPGTMIKSNATMQAYRFISI